MATVVIRTKAIRDWASFHDVFAEAFGFPDFYGGNMNAWIDCMTSLDEPGAGMTSVHATPGSFVVIQLHDVDDFATRCPELELRAHGEMLPDEPAARQQSRSSRKGASPRHLFRIGERLNNEPLRARPSADGQRHWPNPRCPSLRLLRLSPRRGIHHRGRLRRRRQQLRQHPLTPSGVTLAACP